MGGATLTVVFSKRRLELRMTNRITQSPDEYYVIQIDGLVKSTHRRFLDALRAGLLLRDRFPGHDVKLRARPVSAERRDINQATALH